MNQKAANMAVFAPHIEAGTAIGEIDEILAIDGIRIVMLAMTDLSKALGFAFQLENFSRRLLNDIRGALG
jgi:2-keto-3-deoxy-L-rhamnonate aldolase RhmA